MPNKPNVDKHLIGIRMPRTLLARIEKLSRLRGETVKDTILSVLSVATNDIELTSEDYEAIAKKVKEAEEKYRAS